MNILAKGNLNSRGRVEFKYYIDGNEINEEQYYNLLDEIEEDADNDEIKDNILDDYIFDLDGVVCPHCKREIIGNLYDDAYEQGRKSVLGDYEEDYED
jgi:hypothetical protein